MSADPAGAGADHPPHARLRWTTFAALAFGHILLVSTLRLYPFTDLPFHLAAATVVKHLHDPGTAFGAFFTVDLFPKPNVFHILVCSTLFTPEAANRLLVSAYVLAVPLASFLIVRRLGGNPWIALLSFLTLYNFNLGWGFMGYSLAVPVVLFFLYALLAYDRAPNPRDGTVLALLGVFLFALHVLAALFILGVFGLTLLLRLRSGPSSLLRYAIPIAPLGLLFLAWWTLDPEGSSSATIGFLGDYYRDTYLPTFVKRIKFYHFDNRQLFAGRAGYFAAFLFYAPVFFTVLGFWIVRGRSWFPTAFSRHRPLLAFLAVALACFLLLPDRIPRQWFLYERFLVFVALGALFVASLAVPRRAPRPVSWAILALTGVHLLLYADYFQGFERETAHFNRFLLPRERDAVVAGIMFSDRYRGRPKYIHFPNYQIVWRHGIATTSLVDFRFSWVHRREGGPDLPVYDAWLREKDGYDGRYDGCEYLLVRGEVPPSHESALASFRTFATAAPYDTSRATWTLYRNVSHRPGREGRSGGTLD